MSEGWKCPNCGSAHAPFVSTCPEPARVDSTLSLKGQWKPLPNTTGHPPPNYQTTTVARFDPNVILTNLCDRSAVGSSFQ